MIVSLDTATVVALMLLGLLVLTAARLQIVRRQRRLARRRLAEAVGHPSTFQRGRPRVLLEAPDIERIP